MCIYLSVAHTHTYKSSRNTLWMEVSVPFPTCGIKGGKLKSPGLVAGSCRLCRTCRKVSLSFPYIE